MNAALRKTLRVTLLLIARTAPVGVTMELAEVALPAHGLRTDRDTVRAEIDYLVDKGLLAPVEKKISPELKAWRVTADGRDFLAEEGHE